MNDRRGQILAAAEALLLAHGMRKTTVAEIARAAQVGVGTVYLEFHSKDAILMELSRQKYGSVLRAMRRAAMREGGYAARLRAIMNARVETLLEVEARGAHAQELIQCDCEAVQAAWDAFSRAERELLADFLEAGRDDGELAMHNPALTAQAVLQCYASFAPPLIFRIPREQARPLLDEVHRVVIEGLLRCPQSASSATRADVQSERLQKTPGPLDTP